MMNYTTYYLSRYPLFFILINLFLFSSCTEELDDCFFLTQEKVNVNILGKGHCEVNAIEKLHVEIKGDASVFSKGEPILYKRITGKGDVYFTD